jgi:hypothetical protein
MLNLPSNTTIVLSYFKLPMTGAEEEFTNIEMNVSLTTIKQRHLLQVATALI